VRDIFQFLVTGTTLGATYALVALGFSIIYSASGVINFAQGEFVMLGGMSAVFMVAGGAPVPLALLGGVVLGGLAGMALYRVGIQPAQRAPVLAQIIVTIGAGLVLRGAVQVVWGKEYHKLPSFSGEESIRILGAVIMPQSLWVVGVTALVVVGLASFFRHARLGKAILATSYNADAAKLMGINTELMMLISFGMAGVLGAIAGVLIAPISFTYYEVGVMLGLKGFVASVLGGLGSFVGAIAGALVLGITESMMAGYVSSEYKDAVAFVLVLLILILRPNGLLGLRPVERA
jgi:branched-chain amino acid transport system permease protein